MSSPVGMWSKTVMINNLAQRFCICCELCTIDSMTVTWRCFSGNVSQGYEIYFKHVFRRKTSPPSRLHSFTLQFVHQLEICAWESTIARFIISHNYHSCVNTLEMTWSLEAFFWAPWFKILRAPLVIAPHQHPKSTLRKTWNFWIQETFPTLFTARTHTDQYNWLLMIWHYANVYCKEINLCEGFTILGRWPSAHQSHGD